MTYMAQMILRFDCVFDVVTQLSGTDECVMCAIRVSGRKPYKIRVCDIVSQLA